METQNEIKAKEIADNNKQCYFEGKIVWGLTEKSSYEECYDSALQAMQWKDAQIGELKKALIDKACKWLKKQESWDYYNDAPCKLMSDERIAEFRKAMEDEK